LLLSVSMVSGITNELYVLLVVSEICR
jgi:hypothetical protein